MNKTNALGMLIPGGLLIGLGIGLFVNNPGAGMFIGLGIGFVLYGVIAAFQK